MTPRRATSWRRRARWSVAFLVLTMAGLGALVDTSVPYFSGSNGASSVPAGLFVSSQAPSDVLALGQSLGVTPTIMTVYADGSCYCTYSSPPSTSMTLMLGVGALTTSEATSIGQSLVQAGQSDAIIRVMWEQNQDLSGWFQDWNQLSLTAAQYISTFQNIVTTMRGVPGQAFRFMWNPNGGTGNEAAGRTWNDTWPGASYVNYVGVDQYDYAGYTANIQAVFSFAQSQGLPAAIPEWGLNGSDDPSYINGVASLVNNPANNVALQAYFSYDGGSGGIDSDITQFPQSQAAYTVDFGGSSASLAPTTTSPPASTTTTTGSSGISTTPTSPPTAPHVMVVMMENQGYNQIIGNSALPYINSLAADYGSATDSYSYAHPSLPNYLAIASGSNQGVTVDEAPSSSGTFSVPTLGSQLLAAGFSAKAYAENLPADPTNDSGLYAVRHVPWEYFASNDTLPVVDASTLTTDLNSSNAPDFVWYTPNLTDDMHTGQPTDTESTELAGGESFLSSFIPSVQATSWYANGGQIIIEWDEALDSDTSGINGTSGGQVPTIVVSRALEASPDQDSTPVDTTGILHSIEDTFGLTHLGGNASDGNIDALLSPTTPPTTTPPTTTPPTTTPPTTAPPSTTTTTSPITPPTTTPPTTTLPTTTLPSTAPSSTTSPESTSTAVSVVPEAGTSAQGITATVSPTPGDGTVQFTVDGSMVANAVALSPDGTATIALYLDDGQHLVAATYSGSSLFDSSSAVAVVGVGQAPTTLKVSRPEQNGSGPNYQLSATLTSEGTPVQGATVSFSAAGSTLCIATTDTAGVATCTIDDGTTDIFSLDTTGYGATFGGNTTLLPVWSHSWTHGSHGGHHNWTGGQNDDHQPGSSTSQSGPSSYSPSSPTPVSPASALASDTPAVFSADDSSATASSGASLAGGLFVLIGLVGLVLVGAAAFGRRRLLGAGLRDDARTSPPK